MAQLPIALALQEGSYIDTETNEVVLVFKDTVPNDYWTNRDAYPHISEPMSFSPTVTATVRLPAEIVPTDPA